MWRPWPRQSSPSRLLLLDGHSLAYRAFYALPVENFSTTTGQPTNAVYGFTSMLINVLRDEQPTHVAVAFDVSRQTFRTEAFAEYKANRTEFARASSAARSSLVKEVLDALRDRQRREGRVRGRRPHRHARDPGRGRGVRRAHLHRRPRRLPARRRPRHRALSAQGRLRARPHDPGGGARSKYGLDARAVPRLRRPAGRPVGQPAQHPRRRREDRGEVDRRVRLARRAGRARRRGQGQGRRRCCAPSWPRS